MTSANPTNMKGESIKCLLQRELRDTNHPRQVQNFSSSDHSKYHDLLNAEEERRHYPILVFEFHCVFYMSCGRSMNQTWSWIGHTSSSAHLSSTTPDTSNPGQCPPISYECLLSVTHEGQYKPASCELRQPFVHRPICRIRLVTLIYIYARPRWLQPRVQAWNSNWGHCFSNYSVFSSLNGKVKRVYG